MVLTFVRAEPTTNLEHLFALITIAIMGCTYAYAIGSICGIISSMDPGARRRAPRSRPRS